MPLELFALITPLGIAMIVLIVRYSGLSKTARLDDDQTVINAFKRDYPGERYSDTILTIDDKSAAFIRMADSGRLGLVETMGDRFITRLLGPDDIISHNQVGKNTLQVSFRDFTHPRGSYKINTKRDMAEIISLLNSLENAK